MPPPNSRRRAALTDAAIALLAEAGVHGVTHRAVESRAGLPTGTASNYFRNREALLVATAERVVALHHADMDAATDTRPAAPTHDRVVELLTGSLLLAATTHRVRYLAIFELRLESLRRPVLADTLAGLMHRTADFTVGHHAALDLPVPPDAVPALMALYGGALFTLVSEPAGHVTEDTARALAHGIVHGALGGPDRRAPASQPESGTSPRTLD